VIVGVSWKELGHFEEEVVVDIFDDGNVGGEGAKSVVAVVV